ncbi:MAG: lytic transglycosylase domain-containing protein [Spirochaetales bacterium]|nr:lytic transglycosylase domain-containing protein [Spirochaetales bacterium]
MRRTLAFPFVSLLIFVLGACNAVPSSERALYDDLAGRLTVGDHRFLDALEVDNGLVRTLRARDPALPYALGRALEVRGRSESARRVYRIELNAGSSPWNGLGAARLAGMNAGAGNWVGALGHAERGTDVLPAYRDVWYRRGEALYRGGEYRELLEFIEEIPPIASLDAGEAISADELAAEIRLWDAVASWELDRAGEDAFLRAFTRIEAGEIHTRLYLYLFYRSGALDSLSPDARRVLEAVYRIARGEHAEASRLLAMIEPRALVDIVRRSAPDLSGLGGIWEGIDRIAGSPSPELRRWLSQYADTVDDTDLAPVLDVLQSRALRAAGGDVESERASAYLLRAAIGSDGALRDEAIDRWLAIAVDREMDLPNLIEQLRAVNAPSAVFATAVERRLPPAVRGRRWDEIETALDLLPPEADYAWVHIATVLLFAADEGYVSIDPSLVAEHRRRALDLSALDYYGAVARMRHGEPILIDGVAQGVGTGSDAASTDRSEQGRTYDMDGAVTSLDFRHAEALLIAGLADRALSVAMEAAREPDNAEAARRLSRRMSDLGYVSAALDLARRAAARGGFSSGEVDIAILYPLAFRDEVEAAAGEYEIPAALLFGLVREESHFRPRVVSVADAVGLAQILPSTADDIRRRLRWPEADIRNPSDNLRMGAFYLNYLEEQVGDLVLRLGAYNAGLGRGRRWRDQFGDLPPILQVEAIPFIATRWYVRRIAVSRAMFQWRMDGAAPESTLATFFQGA